MTGKENARSGATNTETGKGSNATQSNCDSKRDNITEAQNRKAGKIESLLRAGEKSAIKSEALMIRIGCSERELRLAVQWERECGAVILTSGAGYYLPERDQSGNLTAQGYNDTKRFYKTMKSKGITTLRSAKSARLAIRKYEKKHNSEGKYTEDGRQ